MRGPWRGYGILGAHAPLALAGAMSCFQTRGVIPGIALRHLPMVGFLALIFGQACVLGFWAAFSSASGLVRLVGLATGAVALEFLISFSARDDDFRFMVAIISGVIATVMLVVKRRRAELMWLPPEARRTGAEPLRFSIARLMIFTAVVGVLVGLARNARQAFGHLSPSLFVTMVWSLGFVVMAVAAMWAALGIHRPGWRSLTVLVCASALGALFAYGIGEDDWPELLYFVLINAGESAVVLASLLFLRQAGYRLVGRNREPEAVLAGVGDEASRDAPYDAGGL